MYDYEQHGVFKYTWISSNGTPKGGYLSYRGAKIEIIDIIDTKYLLYSLYIISRLAKTFHFHFIRAIAIFIRTAVRKACIFGSLCVSHVQLE